MALSLLSRSSGHQKGFCRSAVQHHMAETSRLYQEAKLFRLLQRKYSSVLSDLSLCSRICVGLPTLAYFPSRGDTNYMVSEVLPRNGIQAYIKGDVSWEGMNSPTVVAGRHLGIPIVLSQPYPQITQAKRHTIKASHQNYFGEIVWQGLKYFQLGPILTLVELAAVG